jgi:hypothetical protein
VEERESRESNRDRASFTSWAEEASMGNAGSAPEQAKNAVDRAKAEARCVPPLMVRFVPVAAMWHVRMKVLMSLKLHE